jgi:putative ABC transport system permease protein
MALKLTRLIWKNAWRNKRRTILTVSSAAISLFLLTTLAMVYRALGTPYQGADTSPRMMVRRASGIVYAMPSSYGARIRTVPGVAAVTPMNWFGGYWVDPKNQFANFAIDPETVFDVITPPARIPPEQLRAFQRERIACVAGQRLIDKYHWKIGDRITLLGSPYRITPELVLRGIFVGGPDDHFYFHYDYLNEALGGHFDQVGLYWIRLEKPELAARVSAAIDATFRNTDAETKTESENSFLLDFVSMLGNVQAMLLMVGSAVGFAILLIVANTMAMSIRERFSEAAVLRTLGFRARHILGLFIGESLMLTLAGAILGVGGAKLLFDSLRLTKVSAFVWADLRVRPDTLGLCFAIALLIAVLASGWPAYRASRANLAEALRFVG